jgi:hypothetical protein
MIEIVINKQYGGFGLSPKAKKMYLEFKGKELKRGEVFYDGDIPRDDCDLIKVVKTLGVKANGEYAKLKIVTIPDGIDWEIDEYDGIEWVAEKHLKWD